MMRRTLIGALAIVALTPLATLHAQSSSYLYDGFSQNEVGKYWIEARVLNEGQKCYTFDIDSFATKAECDAALPGEMQRNPNWTFFGKCEQVTKNSYTYTFTAPICPGSIAKYGLKLTAGGPSKSTADGPAGDLSSPDGPPGDLTGGGLVNPLKSINSLEDLLTAILDAVVRIGSIILVLALVYVGFLFVVAQGAEEKIRNAKTALLWTIIGGLILLGASAIGAVISATVDNL